MRAISIEHLYLLYFVCSLCSRESNGDAAKCQSNSDCKEGASCVAGDSSSPVQLCVADPPCGGRTVGNCPRDMQAGQLTCIWIPDSCLNKEAGCVAKNNVLGIYKCVSMERCDAYFENKTCSNACTFGGKQCNGRGSCLSTTGSNLICSCDSGWSGSHCQTVVDDTCVESTGQCGSNGKCVGSSCVCFGGYTGKQCEISPTRKSKLDQTMQDGSEAVLLSGDKSREKNSSSNAIPGERIGSNSGKSSSTNISWLAGVIVAAVVLAILASAYVYYSKANSRLVGAAARHSSLSMHSGPATPKQNIVIM